MNNTQRAFTASYPQTAHVAERVLRALDHPVANRVEQDFSKTTRKVLGQLRRLFQCSGPVVIYPSSTLGAWQGALVNTLSPNDLILIYETGYFASQLKELAEELGLRTEILSSDWRRGADADLLQQRLKCDHAHEIKAICIAHNDASTGCCSDVAGLRAAIDRAAHPALFMVDALTSLGALKFSHDEWGIDVTVGAAHKALMLPRGLSFNALSKRAALAAAKSQLPKSSWCWQRILSENARGVFPHSSVNALFFGLSEVLDILFEESMASVIARHERYGMATRSAVKAWNLKNLCVNPAHTSNTVSAILLPLAHSTERLRQIISQQFDVHLGAGLGKVHDKIFRINHMGNLDDLKLIATLSSIEMGLSIAGVPHRAGGVQAAIKYLSCSAVQHQSATQTA